MRRTDYEPRSTKRRMAAISEAIRVLGKSERTVQTLAARGLIGVRVVEEEGKRAQRHYRRADLETLKSKPHQPTGAARSL